MLVFSDGASVARINEDLLRLGVIVRPLKSFGLPQCIRISTGTRQENERCVEAMRQVLSGARSQ
jgi:histidinol-phosphate aminotransferase